MGIAVPMNDSFAMGLDFRKAAIGGAVLTAGGQIARFSLQTAGIILLARLLSPTDFGIAAMVFPVLAFATILQEAGLGAALIQRATVTPVELATLFWLNAAIGLALTLILMLLAPAMAAFYHEPRVLGLVLASAPLVMISALGAQPISLLNRDMKYGALAIIDIVSQAVGFVAGLTAAIVWHSYWAVWLTSAATITTSMVTGWLLCRRRIGRPGPIREVVDMLRFGGHLTINNVFTYFGRNLDNILIGRRWGEVQLGFYDRAYKLLMLPLLVVSSPLQRLIVPILSRAREEPDTYRRAYLSTLQIALLATGPLVGTLLAAPQTGMLVILGPQWAQSAPIFAWLGIASLMQLITNSFGWLYISQGRSGDMLAAGMVGSLWASLAFVLGLPWGAVGVATAYAISECIRTPLLILWVTRKGAVRWQDMTRAVLPFVVAVPVAILLAGWFDRHAPLPAFLRLAGAAFLCYGVTAILLLVTTEGRACMGRIVRLVQSGVRMAAQRLRPSVA